MTGSLEKTPREFAQSLLEARAKEVKALDEGGGIVVPCSMTDLLGPHGLTEVLFDALAPDKEERTEFYGFGNGDIDREFLALRGEILRLARTGRCRWDVIAEGEVVLENLIRGVQQGEWSAKQDINPGEAAKDALFIRVLSNQPMDVPISPNEIDEQQVDAIFVYQMCKHARFALEDMLEAVRDIKRAVKNSQDRGLSPPSR